LLLGQLAYLLVVNVTDAHSGMGFGAGGAIGARFADGRLLTPKGFPPSVTYRIVVDPKPSDVLFAEGERGVFYRRQVHHDRKVGVGESERIQLSRRQQLRVDWLGAMLDHWVAKMPPVTTVGAEWSDSATLQAEVEKQRAVLVTRHEELVDLAVKAGWFTAQERASVAAKVKVKLVDRRKDAKAALPSIQ
jgi:hypothetical protein